MKIKKEFDGKCLNCSSDLQVDDHYCPRCGQKVDRNDLSIRAVLKEFFENYLSLDSRLGRTLIPFFFKPGYLTSQFISGVRRNYANPFRMYIFSSIFFFFCMNTSVRENRAETGPMMTPKTDNTRSINDLSPEERDALKNPIDPEVIEELKDTSLVNMTDDLEKLQVLGQKKVAELIEDSSQSIADTSNNALKSERNVGVNWSTETDGMIINFDMEEIDQYRYDKNYTDEMLYDTLMQGEQVSKLKKMLITKGIKLHRADQAALSRYMLGNLSLAMFVLIPIFAFFLKLLYWRRNKYYVAHLIHTIYLQSFAFITFGFILFLQLILGLKEPTVLILFQIMAFIFTIYFIASFKRIYNQGWLKLLFKSFLLIGIYHFLAAIVFLGEVAISAFLF